MEEFIGKIYKQNCGDNLLVIEKSKIKQNNAYLYRCKFQKYPYEVLSLKHHIINGQVNNPQIEIVEFLNKIWQQNCGDKLRIIEKTIKKSGSHYLYKCEFIKYPYIKLCTKKEILLGTVINPQIEQVEFIDKIWPQNCGDSLKIIKKSENKRGTNFLWECEFIKYPFKILSPKDVIINGQVNNPIIEQEEFVKKEWKQNCGDTLKVIKKIEGTQLFLCKFIYYPYQKTAEKKAIINGEVDNPKIKEKYLGTEWKQNCNDIFIIDDIIYNKEKGYQYKGHFKNYFYETISTLNDIQTGGVFNCNLPYLQKEQLEQFIKLHFDKKVTLLDITNELNKEGFKVGITYIGQQICKFNLKNYINYYPASSDIEEYIRNYCYKLNKNTKLESNWNILEGKEIDIYIPNLYLGIEFNGNFWHSELYKNRLYHQEKSLLAQSKGIKLIHIFEYEWNKNPELLKALIRLKLGIFNKKVFARKCTIQELNNKIYQDFCNENHLQGTAGAVVKLGLYYGEQLVQVMSFSKPRFTDKYEWEIIRECSLIDTIVIGGKERLWKYFVQHYNPKNCISYCDFSKFTGHSYLKLGFKQEKLNQPGFVWWDQKENKIYWRNPYKNQEIKSKGYLKIYDCGQLVFTWFNKNLKQL